MYSHIDRYPPRWIDWYRFNMDYSTIRISSQLIEEIKNSLHDLDWGSIEIYVQNSTVVQITKRQIKKTPNNLKTRDVSRNSLLTEK